MGARARSEQGRGCVRGPSCVPGVCHLLRTVNGCDHSVRATSPLPLARLHLQSILCHCEAAMGQGQSCLPRCRRPGSEPMPTSALPSEATAHAARSTALPGPPGHHCTGQGTGKEGRPQLRQRPWGPDGERSDVVGRGPPSPPHQSGAEAEPRPEPRQTPLLTRTQAIGMGQAPSTGNGTEVVTRARGLGDDRALPWGCQ